MDSLHLPYTESRANFVYFNIGRLYSDIISVLKEYKPGIGRVFDLYKTWIRIIIGLPQENERARRAVLRILNG